MDNLIILRGLLSDSSIVGTFSQNGWAAQCVCGNVSWHACTSLDSIYWPWKHFSQILCSTLRRCMITSYYCMHDVNMCMNVKIHGWQLMTTWQQAHVWTMSTAAMRRFRNRLNICWRGCLTCSGISLEVLQKFPFPLEMGNFPVRCPASWQAHGHFQPTNTVCHDYMLLVYTSVVCVSVRMYI